MLLVKLFKYFPECSLKNSIRCLYYNHFEDNDFGIDYKNGYFLAFFKDFTLKFQFNPYYLISVPVRGYLRKFFIKKGDVVIDAGAHPGVFTLIASRMVGNNGKVIAFEPHTENYNNLLGNIELNDATNVIAIKKSLWSENITLETLQFNNAHSKAPSSFADETRSDLTVSLPAVSLDNELERLGISKIDFLKMDVEGAEIEVIKGCRRILKNSDAKLAIASYHIVNGERTCFELEKLLATLGYETETSFPEHLTTYANK